jgi:hypothetical protein
MISLLVRALTQRTESGGRAEDAPGGGRWGFNPRAARSARSPRLGPASGLNSLVSRARNS